MKLKRRFLVLFFIFGACLCLVGCSNKNSDEKNNKLVMVTNAEYPPYEYKDGNEFKGIDIELGELIAKKMGKELEILDIAFESIIPAITNNKADIALAGLSVTEDRKESIDFSDIYFSGVENVLVRKDSEIEKIKDLAGKKIGVQTGNIADLNCVDDFGEENINRFSKVVDAVEALKNKKIDAVVLDNEPAKFFLRENKESVKILEEVYREEKYAIGVKKDNKDLLDEINKILDEIKLSGELDEIIKKYIK